MDGRDHVEEISLEELVQLAAVEPELYCRTFFPKTVRMAFAPFHHDAWQKLESEKRRVNLLMFRGAGKTSHCRLYTSKSIAYQVSRTILYTGKSETHAVRSTGWIKSQVEHNEFWTSTFGIRQGSKWQDTEFELIVGPEETRVWVIAAGITGSIRGILRDDYRPDLIVLDDVLDDENASTPDQREKVTKLVYGALYESLAPASEAPHAKMISLNTPQNQEDFAVQALKDDSWTSAVYGCWTPDTAELPVEYQESSWPERWPSEEVRQEKKSAEARNTLSTFLREKECKLVSPETASFKLPWLRKYTVQPENFMAVYAIDPVPPPSEAAVQKGRIRTDFEAHVVWGLVGDRRYLLHYDLMRGHEPTWTIAKFFEIQQRFHPMRTIVETVAYQQTLMWILKKAMDHAKKWYAIKEFKDNQRRSKFLRIVNAHNGPATAGKLFIRSDQVDFAQAFAIYPNVPNDDLLDASSMALMEMEGLYLNSKGELGSVGDDEEAYYRIELTGAP